MRIARSSYIHVLFCVVFFGNVFTFDMAKFSIGIIYSEMCRMCNRTSPSTDIDRQGGGGTDRTIEFAVAHESPLLSLSLVEPRPGSGEMVPEGPQISAGRPQRAPPLR